MVSLQQGIRVDHGLVFPRPSGQRVNASVCQTEQQERVVVVTVTAAIIFTVVLIDGFFFFAVAVSAAAVGR